MRPTVARAGLLTACLTAVPFGCAPANAAPFDGTKCPLRPAVRFTIAHAELAGRSLQMRVPSRIQVPAGLQQWTVRVIGAPLTASAMFSLDGTLAHTAARASTWGVRDPSFIWRTLNTAYAPGHHEIRVRVHPATGADAILIGRFVASRCPNSSFFAQASRPSGSQFEMGVDSVQEGGTGPRIVDASVRVLRGATLRVPTKAPGTALGTIQIVTPGHVYPSYALRASRDRRTIFDRRGTRVILDTAHDTLRITGLPPHSRGAGLFVRDRGVLRAVRRCAPVAFRATLRGESGRTVQLEDVDAPGSLAGCPAESARGRPR
jgi:hypothetical protein